MSTGCTLVDSKLEQLGCSATGIGATCGGVSATASGFASVALGENVTASGVGSFAGGFDATASGQHAFAWGWKAATGCIASGDGSLAMGIDALTDQTYAVAIGAYTSARSAGSVAIGELVSAGVAGGADGQNATIVGFGGYAHGRYSHVHGSYCYTQQGAQGAFVCGYKGASERPGEFVAGGGSDYFVHKKIDTLYVLAAAGVPALALDVMGGTFTLPIHSLSDIVVRIVATTAGNAKRAKEVHELLVRIDTGATVSIDQNDTTAGAGSLAAQGWAVTISVPGGGVLSFLCDPGADNVNFFITLEMGEVTGI